MRLSSFHRSRSRRAPGPFGTRTLRDPWNLVVTGVGAGSAWAIGLPIGSAALVGAGMFGVATVVSLVRGPPNDLDLSEPAAKPLRAGTVQANLVNTVHDYRVSLELLQQAQPVQAVAVAAVQATEAARTAETVANRVAHALDAIDDAVTRADRIARQMAVSTQVQESVQRMKQQRRDLLTGLTTAVDEIGEVYAKLLELSTTTDLLGMHTIEFKEATQVSQSLDVIRGVFADLDALDRSVRRRKRQ
jgi:hypothetical protein